MKRPDPIAAVVGALPAGWRHRVIAAAGQRGHPEALDEPGRSLEMENPGEWLDAPGPVARRIHPSLKLYFYPMSRKADVERAIASTARSSACIPLMFAETADHVVVTTPCDINGGLFTPEAKASHAALVAAIERALGPLRGR